MLLALFMFFCLSAPTVNKRASVFLEFGVSSAPHMLLLCSWHHVVGGADKPGSVDAKGAFVTDQSGQPGVWIKEVLTSLCSGLRLFS